MPRSVRDSEEETDVKSGRKTRLTDAISVDSPLRRSSRIKSVKQNDSSPESLSSDISSVSNTQTRVTRRRTGGIDNTTITEKQRTLRSRINSTSSDVNESAEIYTTINNTPTKRRSNIINDVLSKTDNRRGKRFTRAGSESKSPPTRITRHTRAVSLEPEKEENRKILMIALDRTLPSVNEIKEMDVNSSSKLELKDDSLSNIEDNLNTVCHNTSGKSAENNDSENLPSKPEDVEKNTSIDDKDMPDNNKNMSEGTENLCVHAVSQIESSLPNLSQSVSQKLDQNTSKELGLKIENLLSTSMEKYEDFSNKENLAANVIGDESNIENAGSNIPLQNLKPLCTSNPNKLIKEICKSPGNLSLRSRHSRSSESMDDAIVSEKEVNTDSVANNSVVDNMNVLISAEDTDTSDNMPKLAVDADSLSESAFNINSDRSVTLKICSDSSSDGSIEFVKCMEDIKTTDDNDKLIDTDTILNKEVTVNTIVSKDMNAKDDVVKAVTESYSSENIQNNNEVNCTSTRSSLHLTNVTPSTSLEKISTINTECSILSQNKRANEFEGINKVNIPDSNTDSILESLNAHVSPKNSASTDTAKDCVINTDESNLSATVTETQVKLTEGMSEKKKVSENDCLTSNNHSTAKLELDKQESGSMQGTSDKNQEDTDPDDNSCNKNAVNLFQDISADEWKEKNTDIDKNSIHSMSTERLENETEAECDLVLVDKETWVSAENMETAKEKEAFDYDSDDTILLKNQRNNAKQQKNKQMEMDMLENDSKMKVNKDSTKNKTNVDNENVMENTENYKGEIENNGSRNVSRNTSITKELNKHCLPEHNVSSRQSVEEKCSLLNKNNLSEDVPEKQKSTCETDNKLVKSNKAESLKNRKSLNKSNRKEKEAATADLSSENIVISSAKKVKEKRSLNSSSKKQINDIKESDNEFKKFDIRKKENSATKKKVRRNRSAVTSIESDSDNTKSNSDNSQNKVMQLPKFLFAEASNSDSDDANESNSSINSDIQKEYNLHGTDVSKFSDDDVPGDECRASETESSDPNDNGSDLADFVVDDDDFEDEEEEDGGEEEDNEQFENEDIKKDQEEQIGKQEVTMQIQGLNNLEENIEGDIIIDTLNKSEQQNNEEIADKSVDIADKQKSKLNNNKKMKLKKTNTSQLEKSEQEYSSSDLSLSNSIKLKKRKQKRVSNEFTVEDIEQPLNDSQLLFNKRLQKQLSKSMDCSTPKSQLFKSEKLDVSITSLNVSDGKINACFSEEVNEDVMLKTKNSLKKLNKLKNKENVDTCLSSELAEVINKTNYSKPLTSKVAESNKTISIPDNETPTTKYLKKDKLHESVPVLKLDTKFKKSINVNDDSEQNQVKKGNEVVNTSNVEIAEELNTSLKGKLLKVADTILNVERRKKHKTQKRTEDKNNRDTFITSSLHEDIDLQIENGNEYSVSIHNTDKNKELAETSSYEEKKKKKQKRQKITHTNVNKPRENASNKEFIDTKSEVTKKSLPKKIKKKQKKEIIENVSDVYSEKQLPGKKSNEISHTLPNEEITSKQISKKKQHLSSTDIILPSNEIVIEKLSKKRKKLMSEDKSLQYEEILPKKLSKKKQNLSPDDLSQCENISAKKSTKQRDKLLLENDRKNTVKSAKTFKKLQQSKNLDEGPIKFSESRDEALTAIRRTADRMKTSKEMGKKERKEHVDDIQKEGELKNKRRKLNKPEINTNKTELQKKAVKRLSDEVIENLSDVPLKPLKKRKLSKTEQILPPPIMSDKEDTYLEDFVQPSSSGSTTQFAVVNIQKIKKKKVSSVISFKQKMLARNSRQPVSAYLMYLAKQKAVGKDKFCNKPY